MDTETKRGRGRPALPDAERRSARVVVWCKPDEKVELTAAAARVSTPLTGWLLACGLKAARRKQ